MGNFSNFDPEDGKSGISHTKRTILISITHLTINSFFSCLDLLEWYQIIHQIEARTMKVVGQSHELRINNA